MRIAMWSGPRNLSTAMMYSFAQRADCAVWDEPFYAAYLAQTGLDHPMREQILAEGETDPDRIIAACLGPVPDDKVHFYQKHMTQHMIPGIDRTWIAEVTNVFLIRHPARVIASYAAKREDPTADDIGFRQQFELFDYVRRLGQTPIVIDSADIRANPPLALEGLCDALGLPFDPAMLSWLKGGNIADGIWAAHWYGAVHDSTEFAGVEGDLPELSDVYAELEKESMFYYNALKEFSK